MNTALWVVQIVLAVLYVIAGLGKMMGQRPMLKKMIFRGVEKAHMNPKGWNILTMTRRRPTNNTHFPALSHASWTA